jgi:hypothetical protein
MPQQLRSVALMDPAAVFAAEPLRVLGLVDELVPMAVVGRQDLFIGEVHRHPRRVEGILQQLQGPA